MSGADYRPHPAETDRISRLYHSWWKRRGIVFDHSGRPLRELGGPVVAVFSGGLVEGAACGLPTWAYHPDPPSWLRAFWSRYDIAPWGGDPTPPPVDAVVEPAKQIASNLGGGGP